MPSRRLFALACLLSLLPGASAHAEPVGHEQLTIVVSAELDGRLADASCRPGPGNGGQTLGHLSAAVARARRMAEADGREVVAVVHLGDFTGPAALGRYLVAREGGVDQLAGLLARTGFTHAVLGDNWFDQRPEVLAHLARALPDRGLQLLNANVECKDRPDCEALGALPAQVRLDLPGLPIALIGTTGDGILRGVNPLDRKGLEVKSLAQTLEKQAALARRNGAALVLAATHSPDGAAGFDMLTRSVRDVTNVDLLLANHLGGMTEAAATIQPMLGPALAVSGAIPTSVVRIDFEVERNDRLRIVDLRASRVTALWPDEEIDQEVRQLTTEFCRTFDIPLNAVADRAVSPRWFTSFLLDELRMAAQADVGVVNEGITDEAAFPLLGKVTTADIFAALPYEDEVVRASVTGARLRAMWNLESQRVASGQRKLGWSGIEQRGTVVYVNDRPLDDSSRYLVVLPDYLARGGGDLIGGAVDFASVKRQDGSPIRVRELMLSQLGANATERVNLNEPRMVDLSRRPRWTWSGALTLGATDARRENGANYAEPRLRREPSSALRGEATGRVDADTRDHALRLSGRTRYAQASVGGGPRTETEDEIFTEALYRLRGLRRHLGDRWYAPVPYASFIMDTEFARDDGAPFRRLEFGGTLGLRLLPVRPLEIKAGIGMRRQVMDPEGRPRLGLEFGYELPRFSPIKLRGLPVDIESGLDYFVSDMAGETRHEGRLRARLLLPLGGPLAVTAGFDVLAFRAEGLPFGLASDITLGITARLDGARQQF